MCGIAGFYLTGHPGAAEPALEQMGSSIRHRGPDDMRLWRNPARSAGLISTRLSIIDIELGIQPMTSLCGSYTIAFNGEIYNFAAVKQELEKAGSRFRTNSDTEVVLEAYRYWGPSALSHLRGMYAIALYDRRNDLLFLARDPTGIRPLYYTNAGGWLLFASEPKALFASNVIRPTIDPSGVANYLVLGYLPAPETAFRGVRELPAGSFASVRRDELTLHRHWHWERREQSWDEVEAVDRAELTLTESLREHLVADVPIGALLSGGIDSSLLVALLVKRVGIKLDTFSVRFHDAGYNEADSARQVADALGTRHHEVVIDSDAGSLDLVNAVLDQFDQPFADSSAIPTYLLSQAVRRHVKVVLGGDGGDEVFGGYPRFFHADIACRLGHAPATMLSTALMLARFARGWWPDRMRAIRKMLRASAQRDVYRLEILSCYNATSLLPTIMQPEFFEQIRPEGLCTKLQTPHDPGGRDFVDATVEVALPGDYLRKVDFMAGAHGLEVRLPYLGQQVLEYGQALPHRLRYSGRHNKIVLREIARRYLPPEVVRRPKQGFGIPLDSWLGVRGRREVGEMLQSRTARIRHLIRPEWVRALCQPFVTETRDAAVWSRFMLYQQIYMLWSLERWLQKWSPGI